MRILDIIFLFRIVAMIYEYKMRIKYNKGIFITREKNREIILSKVYYRNIFIQRYIFQEGFIYLSLTKNLCFKVADEVATFIYLFQKIQIKAFLY